MLRRLYSQFAKGSASIKIAAAAVVVVWTMVLAILIAGAILFLERPGQALQPTPGAAIPGIVLKPAVGPVGTSVTIQGEAWSPGSMVLVYLAAPGQTQPPSYATAGSVADAEGRFTIKVVIPSGPGWGTVLPGPGGTESQGLATVTARTADGTSAQAFFNVVNPPEQSTATPTASLQATATSTATPQAPTATPQPGKPTAIAITDLNIRGGPGTLYPVLGVLRTGQSAQITGISADRSWWQIQFSGVADGRGWLSAHYVTAQNTQNVPLIQAPPLPATATPTPTPTSTPVVIQDWRGEYFSNPNLSGDPLLVRNDVAINFDWGTGAPAAGLPADNFSVRWSRNLSFPAGTYEFYARVDDGVRLWVDGALVIDQWHDGSATTYSADVTLTEGVHSIKMEYYERSGLALAQLAWERVESYPDWKAEYYSNRKLEGDPVLVRNETEIDHDWGTGSPASVVPSDNFSARWTRKVDFDGGTYRFRVRVDDGARLWVDDKLVIDSWQDGSARVVEAERQISDGKHHIKVEYYEHKGGALIEVSWKRLEEPVNRPPQAAPGGPYTVDEGSLITFDGSGSQDRDGSIVKYEWDFNYDGRTFVVNANGKTASTSYADGPATVTVALRVTDDRGASDLATTQVRVKNVPPTVEAGGPYTGQVGVPIDMAGTATDPSSVDQLGLTYRWDFGDDTQGSGPVVGHSYAQPRNYTVRLTVTDKDGGQSSDTAEVQVAATDQPPTAVISGPVKGLVGETLRFSGNGSNDSDGSIVSYAWDFGDRSIGNGVKVSHVYDLPGRYPVSLMVTDNAGLTDKATLTVHIARLSPVDQPPTAVIGGPTRGRVHRSLSFSGSDSSDSDGSIVSYTWDFGDGTKGSGVDMDHTYNAPGSYRVTLEVTDDGGLTDRATHTVQIFRLGLKTRR